MGLYYREQFKNGAEIVVWEITESEETLKETGVHPNDKQDETYYITNYKRKLERLAVWAILDIIF